jgi:KaiC/GvpD/RAD55 family RecA-like ATPase
VISLEQVVGFALRDPTVMDQLGEALRNDLVVANPFYRRIAEFADGFLLERRKLPGAGDWQLWLDSLEQGMIRDGTKEALGRLFTVDVSGFDPQFFAAQAVDQLQRGAAQVARARLNELPTVEPDTFAVLAEKLAAVRAGGLQGLAHLSDVDTWAHARREDDLLSTGYPVLDSLIGGWGKELWIAFADSGVGKSMLLQNFSVQAALRGKRVLHVTLELGVGPQVRRYYRQIAQVTQFEYSHDEAELKRKLRHWFRLAQGEVFLIEFPAYGLTVEDLGRAIERVNRVQGAVDVLVLDYLDLLGMPKGKGMRNAYEDLGRMTHEVRAFCGKFDITVLTASQAVRRPERAGRLTVRDMGDSYNKVRGADGLLSLVQTDEEEEMHQGRLGVLKVRDSGGRGKEIGLYVNRDLAMIAELDHPNTRQLMERLGHLPGVKK